MSVRTIILTTLALMAFAANSVLCRLALAEDAIDPISFTALRLGSGAMFLALMLWRRSGNRFRFDLRQPRGPLFLLLYALPFSLAYVSLPTATGAILLFGAVQLTMVGLGVTDGERPSALGWAGLLGAIAGVVYLLLPGISAPDPAGAALMIAAGVGWGFYSVHGRKNTDALGSTGNNFMGGALLMVAALGLFAVAQRLAPFGPGLGVSPKGVGLAIASGVVASAAGYAIWYIVLKSLSSTRAALVQLSVPVIAAILGFAVLGETLNSRTVLASAVILVSIGVGIASRPRA